jgi:hypothetical protein
MFIYRRYLPFINVSLRGSLDGEPAAKGDDVHTRRYLDTDREAVLANAPVAEHGFFAVPKVIE